MTYNQPCVSIGLPVYNGENHLKEAIESLLAQSFQDFELIISDNASTDKTSEICQVYAQQDSRIRYVRNPQNLRASRNFNQCFEIAWGKYFQWVAHDDILHPDFLAKTVPVMDQDPSVVLCFSNAKVIDPHGTVLIDDYDRFAAERGTLLTQVDSIQLMLYSGSQTWC